MATAGKHSGRVWEAYGDCCSRDLKRCKDPFSFLFVAASQVICAPATAVCAAIDECEREPERSIAKASAVGLTAVTGGFGAPLVAGAISLGAADTVGASAAHDRRKAERQREWKRENQAEAERLHRISDQADIDEMFG